MIHDCWKYGHRFKITEDFYNYYSICEICGKIGEIRKKFKKEQTKQKGSDEK